MSLAEPKACTTCAHCTVVEGMYLCTLPPFCFDLDEDDDAERDRDDDGREWLGVLCDRSRKQGELCGPAGTLWEPKA